LWGTKQAILMGDWWLTRALMLLDRCHSTDIRRRIHQGLHMMVTGQCHETRAQDTAWPLWRYVVMMARKTALLFALAAQCAGALGNASASAQQSLYRAGLAMGIAYQLDDDRKEYQRPVDTWGIGHDWLQGKMTFPCRIVYDMWPKTQWQAFWHLQTHLAQAMSKQQESCFMGPWRSPLEDHKKETINGAMQEKRMDITMTMEIGMGRDMGNEQDIHNDISMDGQNIGVNTNIGMGMNMDMNIGGNMDMDKGQGTDHMSGKKPAAEPQKTSLITLADVLTPSWRSRLMEMLEALEPGLDQTAWLRQRYVDKGLMAWQNATHTPACSFVQRLFFGHCG
jgi:hypothetical protein